MAQARKEVSPLRDQIQAARNEAIRLLSTEPFDGPAYDSQVNKITDLRARMFRQLAHGVKEVAASVPAEQRHALAEILKRPPPRSPR
jgi:uncharacterized membrane protein